MRQKMWTMNPCRFCSTPLWGHNTGTPASARSSWNTLWSCSRSEYCRAAGEGCRPEAWWCWGGGRQPKVHHCPEFCFSLWLRGNTPVKQTKPKVREKHDWLLGSNHTQWLDLANFHLSFIGVQKVEPPLIGDQSLLSDQEKHLLPPKNE